MTGSTRCLVLLCTVGAAVCAVGQQAANTVNVNAEVGKKPGVTERVTVAQSSSGETMRVITREVTSEPKESAREKKAVAPDTTPRKARVAVVPAAFSQDVRSKFERELSEKWGLPDPNAVENPGFTGFLIQALVNCRKFDVLERENLASVSKELDFGESDYADAAKVVKLGHMINADYVIIPEIRYIGVVRAETKVPYVGAQQQTIRGKLSTSVRTVDVATSKIVAWTMADVGATNRLGKAEEVPGNPARDIVDQLYSASAVKEVAGIIDVAYPIKVVVVSGASCVLNRGEGAIQEGERLSIYKTGEVMTDPDTKETLGYHEAKVGTVRVVKVDQKTCTAAILEGTGQIEKLFIARRDVKQTPPEADEPAPKLD